MFNDKRYIKIPKKVFKKVHPDKLTKWWATLYLRDDTIVQVRKIYISIPFIIYKIIFMLTIGLVWQVMEALIKYLEYFVREILNEKNKVVGVLQLNKFGAEVIKKTIKR
jgi:hypothetical protein